MPYRCTHTAVYGFEGFNMFLRVFERSWGILAITMGFLAER